MVTIRKAGERGRTRIDWLDSWHSFSFGDYRDPAWMGFRSLRVINDDVIAAGGGFGTHPHRDMEIITYVLSGALEHRDSLGTGSVIRPGDVQRMTAGSGILHSEFNPSEIEGTRLLQIWIKPDTKSLKPGYEQRNFSESERYNRLCLIASRDARQGSVKIHQDADVYAALLSPGKSVVHSLPAGRHVWVQVANGDVTVNETSLRSGDAAALSEEAKVSVTATSDSEVLVFDLN